MPGGGSFRPLRGGEILLATIPRIASATADFILGYLRFLPPGGAGAWPSHALPAHPIDRAPSYGCKSKAGRSVASM
jgi:hypothetical protein